MTTKQMKAALLKHQQMRAAERRNERLNSLVVANYPYSHNPYLPHTPQEDCYAGCVHIQETEEKAK